jgi:general L-amino acid transport system permease protein
MVGWMRLNLFSAWHNSALTVVAIFALALVLWYGLGWILLEADWRVVPTLGGRLIIGQYNIEAACPGQNCFWRPQAALLLITVLLGMAWYVAGGGLTKHIAMLVGGVAAAFAFLPLGLDQMGWDVRLLLLANVPAVGLGWAVARYTWLGSASRVAILSVAAFLLTLVLLRGIPGVPFLHPVSVIYWGGLMLNLLLAIAGITLSFPIGIALALGRRSRLQILKLLCIAFIETFRGVPLITLLFMSQVLVPLAFPDNFPQNSLFRAAIVITLFSSAYMAENIRGGLQSLHPGQAEAARALGLPGWQTTLFISLPQAIRNVIPPIVGQFISLFKDTSLVYIIGMLDVVEISRAFIQGNPEYLSSAKEVFIFLALVFWVFTYGMSYVSRRVEQHLGVGER